MKMIRAPLLLPVLGLAIGILTGHLGRPFLGKRPTIDVVGLVLEVNQVAGPAHPQDGVAETRPMTFEQLYAAVIQALREPASERREEALRHLSEEVKLADIPLFLGRLFNQPHPKLSPSFLDSLFRRWAQADTEAALAFSQALPPSANRLSALEAIVDEWTKKDGLAAFDWVKKQPPSRQKTQLMRAVVDALTALNPQKAQELIMALGSGKRALQTVLLRGWAEKDPAGAARAATQLSERDQGILTEIASQWLAKDAKATLAWLKTLPGENPLGRGMMDLLTSLATIDPKMAGEYLLTLPSGQSREDMVGIVASRLSEEGFPAAFSWVQQLPEGPDKRGAQQGLVRALMEYDPKAAMQEMAKMPQDQISSGLVTILAREWVKADPKAASAWVLQSTEGEMRNQLILNVVGGWAKQSPFDAASFAASLPAGELQDQALGSVLTRWTETNPQAAIDCVRQFPEGSTRDTGVESVLRGWSKSDPKSAAAWLTAFAPGKTRDIALSAFADALAERQDPAGAIVWAQSISDEQSRVRATESVARTWLNLDLAAARSWIEGSDLVKEKKEQLLEKWVNP